MESKFYIGQKLKFSKQGLELWLSERRGFYEPKRYTRWRWRLVGYKNGMLVLERTDGLTPMKGLWSPILFEVTN